MRPGPRLPLALGVLALLATTIPAAPGMAVVIAAGLGALLAAAVAEGAALRRIAVTAERPARIVLSLGVPEDVPLSVRAATSRPVRITLRQAWPDVVAEPASTRRLVCAPGREVEVPLPALGVTRGNRTLAPAHAAATLWGLVERVGPAGGEADLAVVPDVSALRRVTEHLDRFALRGLGTRFSARSGQGRELDRLRDYVPGDEPRDLAWKATARHGRLVTREWRLERSQDVLVCLDRGHRMAARVGALSRLDHAVNAALQLAWASHRLEDRIGLATFAADVDAGVPQGRGPWHLRRLLAVLTEARAERVHSDWIGLAAHLGRRLKHRTLVVVMTTLPEGEEAEDLVRATGSLLPRHLPLVVVFSDPDLAAIAALPPGDVEELSRTLVARQVVGNRELTMRELRRAGAMVVETAPGDAGMAAINGYLEAKRRRLS